MCATLDLCSKREPAYPAQQVVEAVMALVKLIVMNVFTIISYNQMAPVLSDTSLSRS